MSYSGPENNSRRTKFRKRECLQKKMTTLKKYSQLTIEQSYRLRLFPKYWFFSQDVVKYWSLVCSNNRSMGMIHIHFSMFAFRNVPAILKKVVVCLRCFPSRSTVLRRRSNFIVDLEPVVQYLKSNENIKIFGRAELFCRD